MPGSIRRLAGGAMIRLAAVLAISLGLVAPVADAQESGRDREDLGRSILQGLSPFLAVKVMADCARLKEYIMSDGVSLLRREEGDLSAVDAIYEKALEYSWQNIPEALLICTFATMDHRRVGVRLPLVGPLLWFPLTSEFSDEFAGRLRALPSRLYPDTPHDQAGDRDKLQHFFGSAFLAYSARSNDPAERIGDFVENTEEEFIVGGVNDERDKRANGHGRRFGLRLLLDESARPSSFLWLIPAPIAGPELTGCVPDTVCSPMEAR